MTTRTTAALAAALLATACGQQELDPAEIRQALPDPAAVRITQPDPSGGSPRLSGGDEAALALAAAPGAPSPLAVTSHFFASAVNLGVGVTLLRLELVTLWPPTSCTQDACTWGPGSGAGDLNRWMLVVTRDGEAYDYVLSGQPKSDPAATFTPVISGTAFPGVARGRGHGTFSADFDRAWAELDHAPGEVQRDFGSLTATYDGRDAMSIGVTFLGARSDVPAPDPADPYRTNAVYDFRATGEGGELQVGFRTVEPHAAGVEERVGLRTRWDGAGAGRADVSYDAVGTPSASYDGSQCWDGASGGWAMTYDATRLPVVGDEASCAFVPAKPFDLTIP